MKFITLLSLYVASSAFAIPHEEITATLREMNPTANIRAYDPEYHSVDAQTLQKIRIETQRLINKRNIMRNQNALRFFDCDDFARVFQSIFALQSLQYNRNYLCATIVVRNYYSFGGIPSRGNPIHMLNLIMLEGVLYVVEPQTMKSVPLSEYPNRNNIIEVTF